MPQPLELTKNDLLLLIGDKEATIYLLKLYIQQLEAALAEKETAK
jgi:hypothetical protein